MSAIVTAVLSFLLLYKYIALFVIAFFLAVGIPLPVAIVLLASGGFASLGYFDFTTTFLVALSAAVLGDVFDYYLAKKYSTQLLRILRLEKSKNFEKFKTNLKKNAPFTIFITRFVGPPDQIVSIFAGSIGIPFKKFIIFDILGNITSVFTLLYVGYLTGGHWQDVSAIVSKIGWILLVVIVLFFVNKVYFKKNSK